MPGRAAAVDSGAKLQAAVVALGTSLGLEVRQQVRAGRRLWGSERRIDVVLTQPGSRRSIGLECKYQGVGGSTEEKIPSTIADIAAWPVPGLVVFAGEGFSSNMRSYLVSTGKAVELDDVEEWLRLFFGLA